MAVVILIAVFIGLVVTYIVAIQFPGLADQIISATDALIFYLGQALDIVWIFVPKTITIVLMSLAIGVEVIVLGYKFVRAIHSGWLLFIKIECSQCIFFIQINFNKINLNK